MRNENFWMEAGLAGRRHVIKGGPISYEAPLEISVFVKDAGDPVRAITIRCVADGLWNRVQVYAPGEGYVLDKQWRR